MRPHDRLALVVAVALALLVHASAQTRYRASDPGRWRPWKTTATPDPRTVQGATAADVKAFEARLLEPLQVNRLERHLHDARQPEQWHGQDIEAFPEPAAAAPVAGHPRLGQAVVIRKSPKPLWAPISLDAAMAPALAGLRARHGNLRDSCARNLRAFNATLTPEAGANRHRALEETAKLLPDGAEFLEETEAADREIEATERRELGPGGPQDLAVRDAERLVRDAEAALAPRPTDERAAAACCDERGDPVARRFRIVREAAAGRVPLVEPNRDCFNPALPRPAPQVAMLRGCATCLEPASLASKRIDGCTVNRTQAETPGWDAVRAEGDR